MYLKINETTNESSSPDLFSYWIAILKRVGQSSLKPLTLPCCVLGPSGIMNIAKVLLIAALLQTSLGQGSLYNNVFSCSYFRDNLLEIVS